ncbi:MAG: hypothetical protein B0W54_23330 [Cellvibrio sp. 79]|nr:MAG: hypothetical protein B0W54_23330 [Cellvibrio sp. 79]
MVTCNCNAVPHANANANAKNQLHKIYFYKKFRTYKILLFFCFTWKTCKFTWKKVLPNYPKTHNWKWHGACKTHIEHFHNGDAGMRHQGR